MEYLVRMEYKEMMILEVIVIDEEGMNENEIFTTAQVNLQNEGIILDWEQLELKECTLKN